MCSSILIQPCISQHSTLFDENTEKLLMKFAEHIICVAYPYSSAIVANLREKKSVYLGNLSMINIPACSPLPMS